MTPLVGSGPPYWGEGPNLTFLKSRSTPYFYKNTVEVPKWRIFCSVFFFTLSEPIWVGDLGTGKINQLFYQLTPDFYGFWFLPHTERPAKFKIKPKLNVGGGRFLAYMYAYNVFFEKF